MEFDRIQSLAAKEPRKVWPTTAFWKANVPLPGPPSARWPASTRKESPGVVFGIVMLAISMAAIVVFSAVRKPPDVWCDVQYIPLADIFRLRICTSPLPLLKGCQRGSDVLTGAGRLVRVIEST